jgi:hypothetical protein
MSKYQTSVVYKVTQERKGKNLEMGNLYFKNVPVTYAQVLKAGKKYQSTDTAYQLNLFIDKDTMNGVETIGVNKEFAEVGVTKIKKGANRGELKYKLDEHNSPYEGMFAAQFSRNTVKRDKEGAVVKNYEPLKVVDVEGNPFTQEVGNGSVCNVKLFAYRNEEDMLVCMLDTVQVLQHVPYTKGGDSFDEELGISVKSSAKASEPVIDEELASDSPADFDAFDDSNIPF